MKIIWPRKEERLEDKIWERSESQMKVSYNHRRWLESDKVFFKCFYTTARSLDKMGERKCFWTEDNDTECRTLVE